MDTGVVGQTGPNAMHNVMKGRENEWGCATTLNQNTVENTALEAVKKKTCVKLEDAILVRSCLIFLLRNMGATYVPMFVDH